MGVSPFILLLLCCEGGAAGLFVLDTGWILNPSAQGTKPGEGGGGGLTAGAHHFPVKLLGVGLQLLKLSGSSCPRQSMCTLLPPLVLFSVQVPICFEIVSRIRETKRFIVIRSLHSPKTFHTGFWGLPVKGGFSTAFIVFSLQTSFGYTAPTHPSPGDTEAFKVCLECA